MMKFESLTVEEAKSGVACGPVAGSDDIELVINEDGEKVYLHLSHFEMAYQLRISEESLVELSEEYWDSDDSEAVLEKMNELTQMQFDWSDDDATEYEAACATAYGKAVELLTVVMTKYIQAYGNEWEFEEWIEEFQESLEGKTLDEIVIPAVPVAWDEEYENDNLYAYDFKIEETDPSGWVDVVMAECTVDNKKTGKTVYLNVHTPGDNLYSFYVSEEAMVDDILETEEALPSEEITAKALEEYGCLEDAKASEYYEVFRRMVYSLEN